MRTVVIFDYGVGNLHSLGKALEVRGAAVRIQSDPPTVLDGDALVLPGVGAFGAAAARLAPAVPAIRAALATGFPCLGICLGMQLLFETSDEGAGRGIGALPGRVRRLEAARVPHMGWNAVEPASPADPLLSRNMRGPWPLDPSLEPRPRHTTLSACRPPASQPVLELRSPTRHGKLTRNFKDTSSAPVPRSRPGQPNRSTEPLRPVEPPLEPGSRPPHGNPTAAEQLVAYFAHSYIAEPADPTEVIAWTEYEGKRFPAAVRRGRVCGVQFHPEKSGTAGLQLLGNFLAGIRS